MRMSRYLRCTAILCLWLGSLGWVQAQPASSQKFKPPKTFAYFGKYKDSATVSVAEGAELINAALKITDAQNPSVTYTLSSFQFAYKRVAVTEDEGSGKVTPTSDMVADIFKTPTLPAIWKKTINANLKKGEQFYFFDIIVKDAKGRLFFAPEIKIYIN